MDDVQQKEEQPDLSPIFAKLERIWPDMTERERLIAGRTIGLTFEWLKTAR